MPRIAGVDIPKEKRIEIALTYIFGIGRKTASDILKKAQIDPSIRAKDLTEDQTKRIRDIIEGEYKVEGDLKREIQMNIKRLKDINCYRGIRHKRGLPVRGQRTHTNSRTRKGPRRSIIGKRKKGK